MQLGAVLENQSARRQARCAPGNGGETATLLRLDHLEAHVAQRRDVARALGLRDFMGPEAVVVGQQGDAVAQLDQRACQIEPDRVAAEHDHVASFRQGIGDLHRLVERPETHQQLTVFRQFLGQIGARARGHQQGVEMDGFLVLQGQRLVEAVHRDDLGGAPQRDAVAAVILRRIDDEAPPVALAAKDAGQVVAVEEGQPGYRDHRDAAVGIARAQGFGGLVAGNAAADDDVMTCAAHGPTSTSVSSQREIEMHFTGHTLKHAPQRMHSLLSIQIAPTLFHSLVSISLP